MQFNRERHKVKGTEKKKCVMTSPVRNLIKDSFLFVCLLLTNSQPDNIAAMNDSHFEE